MSHRITLESIMNQDLRSYRTNGTQCLSPNAPSSGTRRRAAASGNASRARNTQAQARQPEARQTETRRPEQDAYQAPMWQDQVQFSNDAFEDDDDFGIDGLDLSDGFDMQDALALMNAFGFQGEDFEDGDVKDPSLQLALDQKW